MSKLTKARPNDHDSDTQTLVDHPYQASNDSRNADTPPFQHDLSPMKPDYSDSRYDPEAIPLTAYSGKGKPAIAGVSRMGRKPGEKPNWLEKLLGLPMPLIWLLLNSIVSICWGVALAVFLSGTVTITYAVSQLAKKAGERDQFDYTNEIVGLIGSLATTHVTHVLQLALEEYTYVVMAGEFTLAEFKLLEGINEMSVFARFPDDTNRPQRGGIMGWLLSIRNFFTIKRMSWYIIYIGVTLHTTSIVAIMSPQLKIQHVPFGDVVPCGVEAAAMTLGKDPFLSEAQQEVIDKLSFDVGVQLGSYPDQVSLNTTSGLAGRKYRKDAYAYGGIGGLAEGLQDIPGVLYTANCVDGMDASAASAAWNSALPNLSPPTLTAPFTSFKEETPVPSGFGRAVSHPSLSFNTSVYENAMYGVVDPVGHGAFVLVSHNVGTETAPLAMVCSWNTSAQIVHVQMVNFTVQALGANATTAFPSLAGHATLQTLQGMAQAARVGSSIDPRLMKRNRMEVLDSDMGGFAAKDVVEILLADGGKAAMTAYNRHWGAPKRTEEGATLPPLCPANNKTVAEHWRFGNSKNLGWIAVLWTIGIGILGLVTTFWFAKKDMVRLEASPLGATGGFMLGRGGEIDDRQPLRIIDGKVVDVPRSLRN